MTTAQEPPGAALRTDASGGVHLPLAAAKAIQGERVNIYFATNRNPIPDGVPTSFGNQVRSETRFGKAQMVSREGAWQLESFVLEAAALHDLFAEPAPLATHAIKLAAGIGPAAFGLSAKQPITQFAHDAARHDADVLIFVHGAGNVFESALSTAARLTELYGRPGRPIVAITFTYPGNGVGTPLGYFLDRRDTGMSGHAMSEGFLRLLRFLGEIGSREPSGNVWLMAHSLGTYATRVAVQSIHERGTAPPRVFNYVLLMGGGDDYNTLSVAAKMNPILEMANDVVVYFADNDTLLQLSVLANLRKPIGLDGPRNVDAADFGDASVQSVDIEAFSAVDDPWRAHGYFTRSSQVIADVNAVLGGAPPDTIPGRVRLGARSYRLLAP